MTAAAAWLTLNAALLGALWPFGGDQEAKPAPGTISRLEPALIELRAEPAIPANDSAAAREQYRRFLEIAAAHPQLRREAMRRLADLTLEAGEAARYATVTGGDAFYREAAEFYTRLLDSPAHADDRDLVLYQLARAWDSLGESARAAAAMSRLAAEYPDSRHAAEANFRRGELLFVERRYAEAGAAYEMVTRNGPESAFYEQALYKLGWTRFKRMQYNRAVDPFMDLLDRRLAGPGDAADRLAAMTRPRRELVDDTLRALGIAFSYLDGPAAIDAALNRRGNPDYADALYAGLGDLYVRKERYTDAADAYAAFVARFPLDSASPGMQARVIEACRLGRFPRLVLRGKEDFVERYGLHGAFWKNRTTANAPAVVAGLKQHLTDLAAYDHARAQREGDESAYRRAADWYRRYLGYFPEAPDSAGRSFLLAEILFELENYAAAAAQYRDAAYSYGEHDKAAPAAYASLVAFRAHEAALSGRSRTAWHARYATYALEFAERFPDHAEAARVRTDVAEEFFARGELQRAVATAGPVVTMQPPARPELESVAWTVIAHARFELGNYATAEQAYWRLRDLVKPGSDEAAAIDRRIATSIYRQGEARRDAGDVPASVGHFLRVADAMPDSPVVPTALFDAATLLMNTGGWPDAVDVLERFREQFPGHELATDVTQKLAVAYAAAGQPARAAGEYERIGRPGGHDAETRREALWRAADLYHEPGRSGDEARALESFVEQFPAPAGEAIEARQRLADLAGARGDGNGRQVWLNSIVTADARAGAERDQRTRTLAARARLELAAPPRDAVAALRLTIPLADSLRQKRTHMEQALAAYGAAAEYGIADVTTAATYEIGEMYYRLSRGLMESQRPAGLGAEELEQYEILLEEQAFPFEEQAIEIFDANAARTADGIYDEWVRRSLDRLELLMPARYARAERSEDIVAGLR